MREQPLPKKNICVWALYDFANSIPVIVVFLYFPQWLVVDKGVADIWFNMLLAGASFLFLFIGPVAGIVADKRGMNMPYLRITTALTAVGFFATSIFVLFNNNNMVLIMLAACAFLATETVYSVSFTYYNALLNSLAPARLRGFISGIGQSSNWLGQIAGLLITLPLVGGALYLFGEEGRAQAFLPATLLFVLLALPMIIFFKERAAPRPVAIHIAKEYRGIIASFRELLKSPGIGRFLLAYFFFNDAMLTGVNNLPIYIERVFEAPDTTKALLFMGILATSAIGAICTGWVSDKIGLKKMLLIILGSWTITFPLVAITSDFTLFSLLCIILGFLYGSTWTVARAVMSYLAPPQKLMEAFSYYTLYERFATFVGPVAWGLIVSVLFAHAGDVRYRIALFSMAGFIAIGLFIVRKIPAQSSGR